ncbi:UV damage repair endonuclease UvdE [Paenibacillus swuensis]|uniref:UV damage repair endonuclease UvdE n=1 Tax=Paenibacillus swuensis TaxID=1178515 RepID=A0A172TEI3_9BACL|nr:UV DNA damage repair endonuclease UvsE [Paenibacillus swuensis]ANE45420.1 UV damage repair endonuclease UvdE [Paenibacillus swuensis]
MIVRFGYVAMSTVVHNASPSKTMTATNFAKLNDREAAIRKLERLAAENINNSLRLLKHNRAHDIKVYRYSSKLIPLLGHELLEGWNPIPSLAESFAATGDYAKEHGMRVSFHPDHFTVLSTHREDILRKSVEDLDRHVSMLEAMGLDEAAMCNIHIGGSYGDKDVAGKRFVRQFNALEERIIRRITLENDDKTFNALETLAVCEEVGVPMVLDIHHHAVNNEGDAGYGFWTRVLETWKANRGGFSMDSLPPKIHVSSPKSEKDPRGHADYVDVQQLLAFLKDIAADTAYLDVMIEAKMKDEALFRLMEELPKIDGIKRINQASVEVFA